MEINMINNSTNPSPKYSRDGDSGMDLRAMLDEPMILLPNMRALIPTGIHLEIPSGYEGQVRGRSGLAVDYGIGIVNGIGTVDSNYRGDIGVIVINHGLEPFTIYNGDRIAQLVIAPVEIVTLHELDVLSESNRGSNGYGSSGIE